MKSRSAGKETYGKPIEKDMKDYGKLCGETLTGLQTPTKAYIPLAQRGLHCMHILKSIGKPGAHLRKPWL